MRSKVVKAVKAVEPEIVVIITDRERQLAIYQGAVAIFPRISNKYTATNQPEALSASVELATQIAAKVFGKER